MNLITTQFEYLVDLLEDIVKQVPHSHTDLIVCSTKEEVLWQILCQLDRHTGQEVPFSQPQDEDNETDAPGPGAANHMFLLPPTLHLLSASRYCNLVFCPSIPALRGYLSAYVSKPSQPPPLPHEPPSPAHQLIILDLLALHHGTSEFTLQGLSHTFATAVSAADRANCVLKLAECKDVNDPSNPSRGALLWQSEVPLLSGSIKMGERGASWGRRTLSVSKVASRWFRFQSKDP